MNFNQIQIKEEYRSLIDDITKEFYIPLLKNANLYKRAVGFFSSSALIEVSGGIFELAKNSGKIMLIASPYLSKDDITAMEKGYRLREDIIEDALFKSMNNQVEIFEEDSLNLLANLIAKGILDIKIALTKDGNNMGMYHEKMGIIYDDFGNKVAFSGSMNESVTAIKSNYETIDVFCSWKGELSRINAKESAFDRIWNGTEKNIVTIRADKIKQKIVEKFKIDDIDFNTIKSDDTELDNGYDTPILQEKNEYNIPLMPHNINLHEYQLEAIKNWEQQGHRGIFDMATGTGKTFTGLGAIVNLSKKLEYNLAVIIVCPYQHLVEQWVEDVRLFGMEPIIGYSASAQKRWKFNLKKAILDKKVKSGRQKFFCFVTTNATFSSEYVKKHVNNIDNNVLLVVDEAHNFGAAYLSKTLLPKFEYRLALSATINRHNDEEGTKKLFDYFGEKCIEYTLERAISEGKLTQYEYYPIKTYLNDIELEKYIELTNIISKCIIKTKSGKVRLNERGKKLSLQRARLVAGIEQKAIKLKEVIRPYINDTHILVYCGATKMLAENQEFTTIDNDEIRQIDLVTSILGNELGMKVSQFTSNENNEKRKILKDEFIDGENMQVLVAIKCLDEGVNIPKIKTAFILASTTNPKEYIQRRGRVLRLAPGKSMATIFDFITLPRELKNVSSLTAGEIRQDISLVKNELHRANEFARLAFNMPIAREIIDEIKGAYNLDESDFEQGEYYE